MTMRERRKAQRIASENVIHVRSALQKVSGITLLDLSVSGCRVRTIGSPLATGQLLIVRPEGIEGLEGIVRWVEDGEAGIEFNRPLHPSVLDHLVAMPPSSLSRPPALVTNHALMPAPRRFEVFRSVA